MTDRTPRQAWMAVLARADAPTLQRLAEPASLPSHLRLRGPETGLVMVQGRAGGSGAAFNVGEMPVVRCTVRSEAGHIGHAMVRGRCAEHAEMAAALDAALQDPGRQAALLTAIIDPLAAEQAARRDAVAERAAATKVEFFTMATMR